jgi:outer membrane protein assembly factor BamB
MRDSGVVVRPPLKKVWHVWVSDVGTHLGEPIVIGDVAYVTSRGDRDWPASLHAVDIATGDSSWSVTSETPGPAMLNAVLPVGPLWSRRGAGLTAHDARTGRMRWAYPAGLSSASSHVAGGIAVAVARPGAAVLACLDVETGATRWEQTCDGPTWPLATAADLIICRSDHPCLGAAVEARRPADGAALWRLEFADRASSVDSANIDGEFVHRNRPGALADVSTDGEWLFCLTPTRMVAVDAASGRVMWEAEAAGIRPPFVVGERVCGLGDTWSYVVFDRRSGAILTRAHVLPGQWLTGNPSASGAHFFFGHGRELVACDVASGRAVSSVTLPGAPICRAAPAGNRLIVPVDRGLVCLANADEIKAARKVRARAGSSRSARSADPAVAG